MKIKIATEFSSTPGARYREDGPNSGEEFFERILDSAYKRAIEKGELLVVDLDGTEGYATSFLDEAFGRLSSKYGAESVLKNMTIISNDEPDWVEEIISYIKEPR